MPLHSDKGEIPPDQIIQIHFQAFEKYTLQNMQFLWHPKNLVAIELAKKKVLSRPVMEKAIPSWQNSKTDIFISSSEELNLSMI